MAAQEGERMETVEVVIEIPQGVLNTIWAYVQSEIDNKNIISDTAYKAIANGTILPKGHGRLGDLDGIIKRNCFVECKGTPDCQSECEFFDRINDAPTVIEADKDGDADG